MPKRNSIKNIQSLKGERKIVALTASTAPFAKIIDEFADIILVGDSLGMVIYGMESTLEVTVQMMINHGKAVVKASKKSLVVVDMPFGSYQSSHETAFENAAKIISQTNAQALKLEGGVEIASTIEFLTNRGIPVMAHIGLMPQHFNNYGGFSTQGKTDKQKQKILADAKAVSAAGAFAIVIEGVPEKVADEVANASQVPTIGIGASGNCDGQILVTEDMAGLFTDFTPKFVKKYGNLSEVLTDAVKDYANDVKSGKFPSKENLS